MEKAVYDTGINPVKEEFCMNDADGSSCLINNPTDDPFPRIKLPRSRARIGFM